MNINTIGLGDLPPVGFESGSLMHHLPLTHYPLVEANKPIQRNEAENLKRALTASLCSNKLEEQIVTFMDRKAAEIEQWEIDCNEAIIDSKRKDDLLREALSAQVYTKYWGQCAEAMHKTNESIANIREELEPIEDQSIEKQVRDQCIEIVKQVASEHGTFEDAIRKLSGVRRL